MGALTVGRIDRRDLVVYTATLARPAVSKQSGRRGGFVIWPEGSKSLPVGRLHQYRPR